jgi:hypothetical protein
MQPEQERRDPSYIKRIVEMEVAEQLKPMNLKLEAMHDWQLGFWSNGSGRPEGFFQRRMKEDDKRNTMLEDFVKTAQQRQIESEARKLQREKIWQFWKPILKWAGGGLSTALIALTCWLGPKVVNIAIIIYGELEKTHPAMTEKIKTVDAQPNPGVSSNHKPQDAMQPMPEVPHAQ